MSALTITRLRELLPAESIQLDAAADGRDDAIRQAGAALVRVGAVNAGYVDAMLERERTVSTFVGESIAMPHGTVAATSEVNGDALVLLRFPAGIDWSGDDVRIVLGIASPGRGYIGLISQLAGVLLDPASAAAILAATTVDEVYAVFG